MMSRRRLIGAGLAPAVLTVFATAGACPDQPNDDIISSDPGAGDTWIGIDLFQVIR